MWTFNILTKLLVCRSKNNENTYEKVPAPVGFFCDEKPA